MPGNYKDLIMDVATEEMGHVEMIATMIARLLEGAPANGYPWNGRYIVASGNLLADFRANAAAEGGWASGPQPDGQHEFGYLLDPEPLGDQASAPAPDPALYATYDGSQGKPKEPAMGTETGPIGKIKDALT